MYKKQVWREKPKPITSRKSLLEVNDLDRLILLELTYDEITSLIINKNIQKIIDDDQFWCHWLDKQGIMLKKDKSIKECKYFAKNLSHYNNDLKEYHLNALINNDLISIKLLYSNNLVSPDDYLNYTHDNTQYLTHSLTIAVLNNHYLLTKYLLPFFNGKYLSEVLKDGVKNNADIRILTALMIAGASMSSPLLGQEVMNNNIDLVKFIMNNYNIPKHHFKTYLADALENEQEEMLNILLSSSSNTMPLDFKLYYKKLQNKNIEHLKPLILRYLSL